MFPFQFENFYHTNFSGRKLTWLHHLCHGELKLTYLKKAYIITMQTYQMAMLLLFENVDVMSCKDIQVSSLCPLVASIGVTSHFFFNRLF